MTTTITAFNKEITIHPEYYYNPDKIANNPQQAVDNAKMLLGIASAFTFVALGPCLKFLDTMNIEPSFKNVVLGTPISLVALTAVTTTHTYVTSGKSLEDFSQDVENLVHYQYDAALFSLEYAAHQVFEFMS